MEIRFVDRSNELTRQDREAAKRRLIFSLSRFGPEIQHVNVLTQDVHGPRGGGGRQCVIRAKLRRQDVIEASHEGEDFRECFAKSIERIRRSVRRKLDLRRRFRRVTIRTPGR